MTLDLVTRGRTVLMVTRRLRSAQRADRVLVMRDGRLDEQGTHDQLVERGGTCADLWNRRKGSEFSVI